MTAYLVLRNHPLQPHAGSGQFGPATVLFGRPRLGLFEALTLGVFQVGLSWAIVFAKREAFRKAFRGFDVTKVAAMTAHDHIHGCFRATDYRATAGAR